MERPLLAITLGDPAGIGAEIAAKALLDPAVYAACRPLLIGDAWVLQRALALVAPEAACCVHSVATPEEGLYAHGRMDVLDMNLIPVESFAYGNVSAACGNAAYHYVRMAIELAMEKRVDATVTGPLHKEALNLAGHAYAGHTEIYATLTGTKRYCMLLTEGNMAISHVSTHVSLREACDRVKRQRIEDVIDLTRQAMQKLTGKPEPVLAIAGLNPHCGEHGLFGREEIEEIAPAVSQARARGYAVEGPLAPDTVFAKLRGGWYDAVVAMYHDQGHIPLKVLGFVYNAQMQKWESVSGVNITLGLPIIRTSVDHGTAFDQAGSGQANPESLRNAIDAAVKLSLH